MGTTLKRKSKLTNPTIGGTLKRLQRKSDLAWQRVVRLCHYGLCAEDALLAGEYKEVRRSNARRERRGRHHLRQCAKAEQKWLCLVEKHSTPEGRAAWEKHCAECDQRAGITPLA